MNGQTTSVVVVANAGPAQLAGFGVILITVPTPLKTGNPDLSFIEEAGRALAPHLGPGAVARKPARALSRSRIAPCRRHLNLLSRTNMPTPSSVDGREPGWHE